MFKLVVLSAIFAAVAAKPGALIASPLGYAAPFAYSAPIAYSSVLSPATTTISQQASSVVHPSPISYSPNIAFTHFIKKRSAPFTYIAPSTYIANPSLTTYPLTYSSPLAYSASAYVHGSPILPAAPLPYAAAHLIKKRSAPLAILPTTYAASAPLLTSTYTATPLIHSAPIVHSAPLIHSTPLISSPIVTPHFIKKRSAPFVSTYLAPTAYSSQSRVDYTHSSPLISTTSYTSPIAYSSPFAYTHVI